MSVSLFWLLVLGSCVHSYFLGFFGLRLEFFSPTYSIHSPSRNVLFVFREGLLRDHRTETVRELFRDPVLNPAFRCIAHTCPSVGIRCHRAE